jgi:predicted nuclease of predicted toxin-antitoxin system
VKLREPFEYFVDRSLGKRVVVEALRAAGETVHAHDDLFERNTPDTQWLAEVGRRGWVAVTKDKNIRRNDLERRALIDANVACFMVGRGDLSGETIAALFITSLSRVRRVLRRFEVPLAASISLEGPIRVLMEGGRVPEKPKEIR